MEVWIVSWNGDMDCGGRNDGPVGAFATRDAAVRLVDSLIIEHGGYVARGFEDAGRWSKDEDEDSWWHHDIREALVITRLDVGD